MNYLENWFENAKEIVFRPSQFFEAVRPSEGYDQPLQFALVSLVIGSVLGSVVTYVLGSQLGTYTAGAGPLSILGSSAQSIVGGLIGLFLWAGIVHLFVYLLGRKEYRKTFEVISYATAVTAFFGWIPVLNLFAGLYSIYVQARGIENYHQLSFGKALAAVLIPTLVILAFFAIAAIAAIYLAAGMS